jgi:Fe-Mn family superoxide dismutase
MKGAREMTRYTLPDLQYRYDALEPHISGEIMELHHDKHHRAYVEGANRAVEELIHVRSQRDFSQIARIEHELAFHVSGHVLHSMFWQNLAPRGGGQPKANETEGPLARAIERDFGGFDLFRDQLIRAASTIMGSGWAVLVFDPVSRRLGTTQIHDHQSEITQGGIPLLVLDAWEHAYYLQYRNEKKKFFDAVWNVWNWADVAARYLLVERFDLALPNTAMGVEARA